MIQDFACTFTQLWSVKPLSQTSNSEAIIYHNRDGDEIHPSHTCLFSHGYFCLFFSHFGFTCHSVFFNPCNSAQSLRVSRSLPPGHMDICNFHHRQLYLFCDSLSRRSVYGSFSHLNRPFNHLDSSTVLYPLDASVPSPHQEDKTGFVGDPNPRNGIVVMRRINRVFLAEVRTVSRGSRRSGVGEGDPRDTGSVPGENPRLKHQAAFKPDGKVQVSRPLPRRTSKMTAVC